MPIDNFKNRQPGKRGAPSGNLGDLNFRRQISTNPQAVRRSVDNFRRPEGYNPVRRPLAGPNAGGPDPSHARPQQGAEKNSILYKNLSDKYPPLLAETNQALPKKNLKRRIKKWTKRFVLVGGMGVVIIGGFLFVKSYIKLHQIFGGDKASASQAINVGRVNILLMGIGGGTHDGPDLTDTMMIASIDPINNKTVLLSIPRDLWVKMPNNYVSYYQKINAAYESGKYQYLGEETSSNSNQKAIDAGFQAVDKTVSQVAGVPINYNVLVDFQAFQQAVDTVGGITVNVPTELWDPTMAWENNGNPILAEPGVQTMGGSKALMYVRSRETTSDFARSERQRSVIVAIKNKAFSLGTLSNPLKISNLLSAFGDNVRTDLSLSDAETLYGVMKKINNKDIQSADLVSGNYITTGMTDGVSIDEPTAGMYDYSAIQAYVRGLLRNGHLIKENAKVQILNGTTTPGLATDDATTLESDGYPAKSITTGNAPEANYTHTVIVDLTNGQDPYTKQDLEKKFHGASVVNKLPDQQIQPNGANFVIIVGEDEATGS